MENVSVIYVYLLYILNGYLEDKVYHVIFVCPILENPDVRRP